MKRTLFFLLTFTSFTLALPAAPTPAPGPNRTSTKQEKKAAPQETIAQSANGWSYVKGEWIHPDGYKYAKGKVLRTTARPGKAAPKPPGKLALENAQQLTPKSVTTPATAKTEAERKAEEKAKNLAPRAAPQTGSHL
jgi:hypothetical protein